LLSPSKRAVKNEGEETGTVDYAPIFWSFSITHCSPVDRERERERKREKEERVGSGGSETIPEVEMFSNSVTADLGDEAVFVSAEGERRKRVISRLFLPLLSLALSIRKGGGHHLSWPSTALR